MHLTSWLPGVIKLFQQPQADSEALLFQKLPAELFSISVFKPNTKLCPGEWERNLSVFGLIEACLCPVLSHHYLWTCTSTQRFVELKEPHGIPREHKWGQTMITSFSRPTF